MQRAGSRDTQQSMDDRSEVFKRTFVNLFYAEEPCLTPHSIASTSLAAQPKLFQ
jgi:hypothetical protein